MKKAEILGLVRGVGTSRYIVRCICGAKNTVYIWAWAGNGCAKCYRCGGKIDYRTLKVTYEKGE